MTPYSFDTLAWYLFFKPYDYSASNITKTFPGPINQSIKFWANINKNTESLRQQDLLNIGQQLKFNDSI